MYMVIRKYYIIPGSSSALQQRVQTELAPLLSQIPGFLTHYLLRVGEDKIVSVSIFDSKGNADLASGPTGFCMRHLSSALGDCILGLPEIVSGQTEVYSGLPLASQPEPAALRAQFEARLAGIV